MLTINFKLQMIKTEDPIKFATGLVYLASQFISDIVLISDKGTKVDLKSILGVISIQVGEGKVFTIKISGKDEETAKETLRNYIHDKSEVVYVES